MSSSIVFLGELLKVPFDLLAKIALIEHAWCPNNFESPKMAEVSISKLVIFDPSNVKFWRFFRNLESLGVKRNFRP